MSRPPSEIFDCARVSDYLESYLLDQVPPPERRGMRLHIHACSGCFARVLARDPLQVFAPLADQDRPEAFWEGFWPGVADGIRREKARRASRRAAARAAALVLLAAGAVAYLALSARREEPRPVAAGIPATAAPVATMPQTVEQARPAGVSPVQVYSMNYYGAPSADAGGAAQTPVAELVLIVDAGIEL